MRVISFLSADERAQKRPVHKHNLKVAEAAREHDKKHPEPMGLIRKREKSVDAGIFAPVRNQTPGEIDRAATAMAAWDNSDPFAYGRTALHVRHGFLRSEEVVKEVSQRTIARRAAKVKEVEDAKNF